MGRKEGRKEKVFKGVTDSDYGAGVGGGIGLLLHNGGREGYSAMYVTP